MCELSGDSTISVTKLPIYIARHDVSMQLFSWMGTLSVTELRDTEAEADPLGPSSGLKIDKATDCGTECHDG